MPGTAAALAEQRRLLVARDAGDRDAGGEAGRPRSRAAMPLEAHTCGSRRARNVEQLEQLLVPLPPVDVVEQRARGVALIGHVRRAARELPDEPAVDRCRTRARPPRRARARRARCRAATRAWSRRNRRRAPGRSSRVMRGSRPRARSASQAAAVRRSCQTIALAIGSPGRAIPHHGGLALVGDADGGDVRRPGCRRAPWPPPPRRTGSPRSLRVVLDPARLRKDLAELLLRNRLDRPGIVEHDGARAGGALVQREDVSHGGVGAE